MTNLHPTKSTTAFANERPPNGNCIQCSAEIEPFLRPELEGLPARWILPSNSCNVCLEKQESEEKIREQQRILDDSFRHSRVSPHFKQRAFESFIPASGTERAYQIALQYKPDQGGLLFFGSCGVGKTHLAASIANDQLGKTPVLFVSCPEFLSELREGISIRKKEAHYHLMDLSKKVQLLIFDDIGAEKPSEWVQETLFVLINYRYEHLLPTILTTNCSIPELEHRLGTRITSRLIEMCRCVSMSGEDWRIKIRKERNALVSTGVVHG